MFKSEGCSTNATHLESLVVGKLSELNQNEAYLKMSVAEMNNDLERKTGPLREEAQRIRRRLKEIEQELGRYVKALGQGKLSIGRLEAEVGSLELDRHSLQIQLDGIERRINESAIRDYNAELLQQTLRSFKTAFTALTPSEQSEALQCVLKGITVHPNKLALEIFELEKFHPGSQNRKDWLPMSSIVVNVAMLGLSTICNAQARNSAGPVDGLAANAKTMSVPRSRINRKRSSCAPGLLGC